MELTLNWKCKQFAQVFFNVLLALPRIQDEQKANDVRGMISQICPAVDLN